MSGYQTAPELGGLSICTPIPEKPDPSQIVGVLGCGPREPEPELPPIPPPGFYWAKLNDIDDSWTTVQVVEIRGGDRIVRTFDWATHLEIVEWGPALAPPA